MNSYINTGNTYHNDLGRRLCLGTAMIEEQHVNQYGSLFDPDATRLENLLLHRYTKYYPCHSFYQDELNPNAKSIWEFHLEQKISHLHKAVELLNQYERKDWQ